MVVRSCRSTATTSWGVPDGEMAVVLPPAYARLAGNRGAASLGGSLVTELVMVSTTVPAVASATRRGIPGDRWQRCQRSGSPCTGVVRPCGCPWQPYGDGYHAAAIGGGNEHRIRVAEIPTHNQDRYDSARLSGPCLIGALNCRRRWWGLTWRIPPAFGARQCGRGVAGAGVGIPQEVPVAPP